MPTSETGRSIRRAGRGAGFTLLELVVVLTVVGVIMALASLAVPDSARTRAQYEAERLVEALEDCRRVAILTGVPGGIQLGRNHFQALRYRDGWQPAGGQATAAHRLAAELTLSATAANRAAGDHAPEVVCLPSGETLMPVLSIAHDGQRGSFEIFDDEHGSIVANWVGPPS